MMLLTAGEESIHSKHVRQVYREPKILRQLRAALCTVWRGRITLIRKCRKCPLKENSHVGSFAKTDMYVFYLFPSITFFKISKPAILNPFMHGEIDIWEPF